MLWVWIVLSPSHVLCDGVIFKELRPFPVSNRKLQQMHRDKEKKKKTFSWRRWCTKRFFSTVFQWKRSYSSSATGLECGSVARRRVSAYKSGTTQKGPFKYSGLSSPPTNWPGMGRPVCSWRLEVVMQVWTLVQVWSLKSVTFHTCCSLTWLPARCLARCFRFSSRLSGGFFFFVTFDPIISLFILKCIS